MINVKANAKKDDPLSVYFFASAFCSRIYFCSEKGYNTNKRSRSSRHFQKNSRTVIQPQKLTSDIIEKLNNNSVADALRYFSGVQIKDYGGVGGLKTVDIRSLGAQHVGVFYDGIPIGNAQNGIVDLGKFFSG